jgi:hypothetical protein
LSDIAAIENEIRGNLLKAGGAAFVPEDPKAFLTLEEVKEIIIDAAEYHVILSCLMMLQVSLLNMKATRKN